MRWFKPKTARSWTTDSGGYILAAREVNRAGIEALNALNKAESRSWPQTLKDLEGLTFGDLEAARKAANMKSVYIAGPMRGIPEFNFPEFHKTAKRLRAVGYEVFSPAENDEKKGFQTKGMTGDEDLKRVGFDLKKALQWDLEKVMNVDYVCLLEGSENSKGTAAELALAKAIGTPILSFYQLYVAGMGRLDPEKVSPDDYRPWNLPSANYAVTPETFGGYAIVAKDLEAFRSFPPEGPSGGSDAQPSLAYDPNYVGPYSSPKAPEGPAGDSGADEIRAIAVDLAAAAAEWAAEVNAKIPDEVDTKEVFNRFTGETRSVSSTGGQKGVKRQRFDLIPVGALTELAEHYGAGAEKYADNQWRKGYEWSKSYAAMQRHITQFWGGEDFDEETGSNHMAAVAWHAFTLLTFFKEHPGFDDRYKGDN